MWNLIDDRLQSPMNKYTSCDFAAQITVQLYLWATKSHTDQSHADQFVETFSVVVNWGQHGNN